MCLSINFEKMCSFSLLEILTIHESVFLNALTILSFFFVLIINLSIVRNVGEQSLIGNEGRHTL